MTEWIRSSRIHSTINWVCLEHATTKKKRSSIQDRREWYYSSTRIIIWSAELHSTRKSWDGKTCFPAVYAVVWKINSQSSRRHSDSWLLFRCIWEVSSRIRGCLNVGLMCLVGNTWQSSFWVEKHKNSIKSFFFQSVCSIWHGVNGKNGCCTQEHTAAQTPHKVPTGVERFNVLVEEPRCQPLPLSVIYFYETLLDFCWFG